MLNQTCQSRRWTVVKDSKRAQPAAHDLDPVRTLRVLICIEFAAALICGLAVALLLVLLFYSLSGGSAASEIPDRRVAGFFLGGPILVTVAGLAARWVAHRQVSYRFLNANQTLLALMLISRSNENDVPAGSLVQDAIYTLPENPEVEELRLAAAVAG